MPKRVLVTGGAGFIGSHASKKLLDKGYQVVIVDNMNNYYDPKIKKDRLKIFLKDYDFKFYKTDISKYNNLAKVFSENKFDIICHLAAQAGVRYSLINPWAYEQSNVLGTLNLLELSKKHKIKKFVYASSSSVYGGNTKLPFSESDKVDKPISLYAATKKATENLTYSYHHLFKINIVGLRFFTVYGPWGRPDMACYKFANLIHGGKPIDVYNYGKMKRDFTYIDDVISGVMTAIEKNFSFEIFNLGNNKPVSLMRFIDLLEKHLGMKAKKNYLPLQAGDVVKTWADIRKAKRLLGYSPKTKLENGLKRFTEWYKKYYKLDSVTKHARGKK